MSKVKIFLKEMIRQQLLENGGFITLQQFEKHILDHRKEILSNMKTYGFSMNSVKSIKNYYDLASITGLDSRLLKTVELPVYSETLVDLLRQR